MTLVITETQEKICTITLNRTDKHNALNEPLLKELQAAVDKAIQDPKVRVLVLAANGKHFSAGADIASMQTMVELTEAENLEDAKILSNLLYSIYNCPKPTIAMVHGSAFGGGAGLVAVCDLAVAAHSSVFCFSEVRLGLIPAVISPYVIRALGPKTTKALFVSAEPFDAKQAENLELIHHCVDDDKLLSFTRELATKISHLAPSALTLAKELVNEIAYQPINESCIAETVSKIAKIRVSKEAQTGLHAFLNKQKPEWNL